MCFFIYAETVLYWIALDYWTLHFWGSWRKATIAESWNCPTYFYFSLWQKLLMEVYTKFLRHLAISKNWISFFLLHMLLLTGLRKYCTRICFYNHILQVTVFHKYLRILVFELHLNGIRIHAFIYDIPFQYSKSIFLLPSFCGMKISAAFWPNYKTVFHFLVQKDFF